MVLRRGYSEGLWLLLWAALPGILVTQITGDGTALAMLLATACLALVLRATMSMTVTALASAAVALLTAFALMMYGQALLVELSNAFAEVLKVWEQRTLEAGGQPSNLLAPTKTQLAGMMGVVNGALGFLCLTLARYWQAALYNPGGFGREFRALRLPVVAVFGCALLALLLASQGVIYRSWGAVFLIPLTIGGFALLHARAEHRGQSSFWMGGVYAVWVVFDAAKLALVGLAVADAVFDFRRRWTPHSPAGADVSGDDAPTPGVEEVDVVEGSDDVDPAPHEPSAEKPDDSVIDQDSERNTQDRLGDKDPDDREN
ncbi:MAG: hypothetical protein AB8B57_03655 [Congregibacter sp.]